jgi:hypothetical protein
VRWFGLNEALAIADEGLVDGLRRLKAASATLAAQMAGASSGFAPGPTASAAVVTANSADGLNG